MNPIQSLQHMLNHLARTYHNLKRLGESGIFDEATLEAVMVFQRDFGLPVTGVVDQATWDAITAAYYLNLFQTGSPPSLQVLLSGNVSVPEGGAAPAISVIQILLSELADLFSNFEPATPDGMNRNATTRNLRRIQALAALPQSGALDRGTWAIIASLFSAFITRGALGTLPL